MKILVSYSPPVRKSSTEHGRCLTRLEPTYRPVPTRKFRLGTLLLRALTPLVLLLPSLSSQENSPQTPTGAITPPVCLTLSDGRNVNDQLFELKAVRVELVEIRNNHSQMLAQHLEEKAWLESRLDADQKALEIAQQRLEIAERELQIAKEGRDFFEKSYKDCKTQVKGTKWCNFKKHVFFFWPWRCK